MMVKEVQASHAERFRALEQTLQAARRTRESRVATDETQRLADHIREWAQAQNEWDVGTTLAGLATLANDDLRLLAQGILDGDWRVVTSDWESLVQENRRLRAELSDGSEASGTYDSEHVGLYDVLGRYEGGCACGWEGSDIYAHVAVVSAELAEP